GAELQGLVPEQEIIRNINTARDYYFLWSLERVAVAYGVPAVGNKDWYNWCAPGLLAAQQRDGGWRGKFGADIDTCFALLFLRRANLAEDLTAYLKGQVKDPGQAVLKSSSGGGEGLAGASSPARKPPFNDAKPRASSPRPKSGGPQRQELAGEVDPTQLSKELVQASPVRQDELLASLRDG